MSSRRPVPAALLRAAAVVSGLILAALAGAGPVAAAPRPLGDCTAATGVIVAVDFSYWGGPVLRSCGSTPTSGYALLNQGGWQTTGTEHDGPGFVCRIGYAGYRHDTQYPTPAQQACVQTPPASAYWASWQAGPGQATWTYSRHGALGDHPAPGSVTLWVFGGTNVAGTTGSALPPVSPGSLRALSAGPGRPGSLAIHDAPPVSASRTPATGTVAPTGIAAAIAVLLIGVAATAAARRRRLGPS